MEPQGDKGARIPLDQFLWDVLIVGGSVAGLSAALALGRSRRRVLIVDAGEPANRRVHASHNFFTRDGTPPAELLEIGRSQLAAYPTVTFQTGRVVILRQSQQGYVAALADERICYARKVLLATGVRDQLPPLAGIEPLWGRTVIHCPYCDGWEFRDRPLAVYAQGDHAVRLTRVARNLTADLVLCTGGPRRLRPEDEQRLARWGVQVVDVPVARLHAEGDRLRSIEFVNGSYLDRDALYVQPVRVQPGDLLRQVGCATNAQGIVEVDDEGRTSVPNVYAAGDLVSYARHLSLAVHAGAAAGMGINWDLLDVDLP